MCIISLKWICFLIISVNHIWCKDTKCQIELWFIRFIIFDNFNFVQLSNSNHFRQYFFTKVFVELKRKIIKSKLRLIHLVQICYERTILTFCKALEKCHGIFPWNYPIGFSNIFAEELVLAKHDTSKMQK